MRLFYATSIAYPSPYANRIQTLSTAEALAEALGDDFCLGANAVEENSLYMHRVENFGTRKSVLLAWKQLAFIKQEGFRAVYSREPRLLYLLMWYNCLFFRLPLTFFFEAHGVERTDGTRFGYVLRNCERVFCITSFIAEELSEKVPGLKTTVLPDAVSLELFSRPFDRKEARARYGIEENAKVAAYTGSVRLHEWKGDDVFMASWKHIEGVPVEFFVAGARGPDIDYLRDTFPEVPVHIPGWLDREAVTEAMRMADVLVLPNRAGSPASERYTSPMKLFEYLASGTPIVASDLPSIREIVDEASAVLVPADDPRALGEAIEALLRDPERARSLAANARSLAEQYTWPARAKTVLAAIAADMARV